MSIPHDNDPISAEDLQASANSYRHRAKEHAAQASTHKQQAEKLEAKARRLNAVADRMEDRLRPMPVAPGPAAPTREQLELGIECLEGNMVVDPYTMTTPQYRDELRAVRDWMLRKLERGGECTS